MLPPLHLLQIGTPGKRELTDDGPEAPKTDDGQAAPKRVRRDDEEAVEDVPNEASQSVQPPVRSEYDTFVWPKEHTLDMNMLKYDMAETVNKSDQTQDPPWLQANTDENVLYSARRAMRLVKPASTSPRQEYVKKMCAIRPFGLGTAEFLQLMKEVEDLSEGYYYMYALPVDPMQKQYGEAQPAQASGIVIAPHKLRAPTEAEFFERLKATEDNYPLLDGLIERDFVHFILDVSLWTSISKVVKPLKATATGGSSNNGFQYPDRAIPDLKDKGLFTECNKVFTGTRNVYDNMVRKTGLWYRYNKDPLEEEDQVRAKLEMYMSLWSSLVGTSLPIYYMTCRQGREMISLTEKAMGDLRKEAKVAPRFELRPAQSRMIGRRFASCMLRLAEMGFVLTDNKPGNMLLQASYEDVAVADKYPFRPVADVVATDIDPYFSLFVGSLDPRSITTQGPQSHDHNVEAECIRFVNTGIFTMVATCHSMGNAIIIRQWAALILKRYADIGTNDWKGAFLCKYFFDPTFMKDYKIHGTNWATKARNKPETNDFILKSYEDDNRDKAYWEMFWSFVAEMIVSQTFHYGMHAVSDDTGHGLKCHYGSPFSMLKNDVKLEERLEALGATERDENKPTFGVILALLAQWAVKQHDEDMT